MRFAFYTASGARYLIDTTDPDNMTWKREGDKSNQEVIPGVSNITGNDGTNGRLYAIPHIHIGQRAEIQVGPRKQDYILCTAIQRIELL